MLCPRVLLHRAKCFPISPTYTLKGSLHASISSDSFCLLVLDVLVLFTGQQAAPSLTLPQTQGSIFGAQTNQQPQLSFGPTTQPPPSTFKFSAGSSASGAAGSGGLGIGGATPNLGFPSSNTGGAAGSGGLGIGGATPNLGFPSSNTGGLNFGAVPTSQGTGLGATVGQTQANSSDNGNKQQQGFQFNPNAGINFNFGSGQMTPMGSVDNSMLFSAGSSQSSAPSPSTRVFKKARRRAK